MKIQQTVTAWRMAAVMTCALAALAVLLLLPGPERAHATASDDEEYGVLFTAPGVDETYAYCAGCHSERIVAQQGLTRDGWVEILEWMVEEQGMGEIEEPDLTLILDYLTKHYNEDRPNFPRTN